MKKVLILLIMVLSVAVYAQEEMLVNTFMDSTQRDPHIALGSAGEYVVVWMSLNQISLENETDIYLQRFDANHIKIGTETLVNIETSGRQERPVIAMNANNDGVIAWATLNEEPSMFDVKARLIKNGGLQENEILVNTYTNHSQTKPSVAIDADGNFVVAWESWYQDASYKGVYAQRFDSDGNKVGDEFRANQWTLYSQGRPTVEMFANGDFVIVWESWKQDLLTSSGYGLFGRTFAADGTPLVDEFQMNTYTNDYQWFGDVVTLDNDNFIAAWCSWRQDGFDGGIYLQKFTKTGEKFADEALVNKTTDYYQWLPKVTILNNNKIAVIWSSWLQDGDREGVYTRTFNQDLTPSGFEERVNDYTESYQWEPTFVPWGEDGFLATWSSWGQFDNDYEVIAKTFVPGAPQGIIDMDTYSHNAGISTAKFFVHVVDSTALTGHEYQLSFPSVSDEAATVQIKDNTDNSVIFESYQLDQGGGAYYLTPEFDGIRLEIVPEFEFAIDKKTTYMINNSGTNIDFTISEPSGNAVLAPITTAVIFGSTETDNDGKYVSALDTAYNPMGQKIVLTPFMAWNASDGEKIPLFVTEKPATENGQWDMGEDLVILTPERYQKTFPNFHVLLLSSADQAELSMPTTGDTLVIYTKRPVTTNDVYTFTTNKAFITTDVEQETIIPKEFALEQNYPNPFNPSTTIRFSIPESGNVSLKVYNVMGELVSTLIDESKNAGTYRVAFEGQNVASGVYFYTLTFGNKVMSKKMILMK